jgi:two-component system chemotaxis response regulator CheY
LEWPGGFTHFFTETAKRNLPHARIIFFNAGTTFMPVIAQKKDAPAKRSLRILYADDLRELRDVVDYALTRDSHAIECVNDGRAAWERISGDPAAFDVLITDHHMPNLSGLELVTRLRGLPFQGEILVFSSELSDEVHAAYQRMEVTHLFQKPVSFPALRAVLANLEAVPTPGNPAASPVSGP